MATVRNFEVMSDKLFKKCISSVIKVQWNLHKEEAYQNETFLRCRKVPFNTGYF